MRNLYVWNEKLCLFCWMLFQISKTNDTTFCTHEFRLTFVFYNTFYRSTLSRMTHVQHEVQTAVHFSAFYHCHRDVSQTIFPHKWFPAASKSKFVCLWQVFTGRSAVAQKSFWHFYSTIFVRKLQTFWECFQLVEGRLSHGVKRLFKSYPIQTLKFPHTNSNSDLQVCHFIKGTNQKGKDHLKTALMINSVLCIFVSTYSLKSATSTPIKQQWASYLKYSHPVQILQNPALIAAGLVQWWGTLLIWRDHIMDLW